MNVYWNGNDSTSMSVLSSSNAIGLLGQSSGTASSRLHNAASVSCSSCRMPSSVFVFLGVVVVVQLSSSCWAIPSLGGEIKFDCFNRLRLCCSSFVGFRTRFVVATFFLEAFEPPLLEDVGLDNGYHFELSLNEDMVDTILSQRSVLRGNLTLELLLNDTNYLVDTVTFS